jgi:hypothetical protein
MATRVWESAHIKASIDKVWAKLRPLDFSFNPNVEKVEIEGKAGASEVGGVRVVTYKDGAKNAAQKTTQKIKLVELSDAAHSISWDLLESAPAVSVLSQSHSVKLRRITEDSTTFIEWTTDYSKDASHEVIEDQRHKQRENFKFLSAATAAAAPAGKGK